jgi:hypothetical protein
VKVELVEAKLVEAELVEAELVEAELVEMSMRYRDVSKKFGAGASCQLRYRILGVVSVIPVIPYGPNFLDTPL